MQYYKDIHAGVVLSTAWMCCNVNLLLYVYIPFDFNVDEFWLLYTLIG